MDPTQKTMGSQGSQHDENEGSAARRSYARPQTAPTNKRGSRNIATAHGGAHATATSRFTNPNKIPRGLKTGK